MLRKSNQPVTGTILVADDQASNRELLEELLTAEGFKVASVANGAAALEQLSVVPVDLVLLDVMMPQLTGFEACENIKANPDTYLIPVILITALSDKQDRIEGIKAGADDFLTRPVPALWIAPNCSPACARFSSLSSVLTNSSARNQFCLPWPAALKGRTLIPTDIANAWRSIQRGSANS